MCHSVGRSAWAPVFPWVALFRVDRRRLVLLLLLLLQVNTGSSSNIHAVKNNGISSGRF